MGRKTLTKFNMEKDEWYYQPKIYLNRQYADSTYRELKQFRLSMNQGAEEELVEDNILSEFSKEEEEQESLNLSEGHPMFDIRARQS